MAVNSWRGGSGRRGGNGSGAVQAPTPTLMGARLTNVDRADSPPPLWGGMGWGVVPWSTEVPHLPTPTPDPSPAEPRYSEGSATQKSDRSRQQPTSIGGGRSLRQRLRPALSRTHRRGCGAKGCTWFWRKLHNPVTSPYKVEGKCFGRCADRVSRTGLFRRGGGASA